MPDCSLPEPVTPGPADPALSVRRDRDAQRIVSELCRGVPVCLGTADGAAWLVAAIETLGTDGLADLAAVSDGPALLVTWQAGGAARASVVAIPRTPAALAELPRDGAAPVPPVAPAAMRLLKAGRLLLQAVLAPVRDGARPLLRARGILTFPAEGFHALIRACPPEAAARARVPLDIAPDAEIVAFRVPGDATAHFAIVIGDPAASAAPLVRVHSECFTGDLLGSLRCDCGPQLRGAIARMVDEGAGVLLYLSQEGRGIGLVNKLRAYALQDTGLDTADANEALGYGVDERDFSLAACMLSELGVGRIRLLTNNPHKVAALREAGVDVASRVPLMYAANGTNDAYLAAKFGRLGHLG